MTAESPDNFVFNPYAPGFDEDPSPTYRYLQTHAPVYFWARGQAYLLSKYEDVVQVIKDPRFSRSMRDGKFYRPLPIDPEYEGYRIATENGLFMVSPASHLRLRRLVNPAFAPKSVAWLSEQIGQITREALAEIPDGDVVDLAPLANNIPMRVISRLLAIPAAFEERFLEFGRIRLQLLSPDLPPERRDRLIRDLAPGYAEIRALVAERRASPGDDFMSTLIHYEEEGTRLSEPEMLGIIESLIVAGTDTTGHTLRFLMLDLLRHPEQLARLRADPGLVRAALDESLRYNKFNRLGVPVFALEDVELRGVRIERGSMVIPLSGAAGRDPDAFERADEFDIGRPDLGEVRNFGAGPHACLGLHLARLEFDVIVPLVLERFPEMSLAGPPEYTPHAYFRVVGKLPVRVRA